MKNKILLTLILIIISVLIGLDSLNKEIKFTINEITNSEVRKHITKLFDDSIKSLYNINADDLFIITKDNDRIVSIDFNNPLVNKYLVDINEYVNSEIDKKDLILVPTGIVSNNVLLSNLGINIPVSYKIIGSIMSNLETKVSDYGINNALIEIYIHMEIKVNIILPFTSNVIKIDEYAPISIKILNGEVPNYYNRTLYSTIALK